MDNTKYEVELRTAKELWQRYFEADTSSEKFKVYCYGYLMSVGYYPNSDMTDAIENVMAKSI